MINWKNLEKTNTDTHTNQKQKQRNTNRQQKKTVEILIYNIYCGAYSFKSSLEGLEKSSRLGSSGDNSMIQFFLQK
jgi:hypothetical protein